MVEEKKFKSFVENGHIFELEYGEPKVYDADRHDYITCVICNDGVCVSCDPDFETQVCDKREGQPTLPGLEYLQEKK